MKCVMRLYLFGFMLALCACENRYETHETSLLRGKWVRIDNNYLDEVTFTDTHIKMLRKSRKYMVSNNVIHIWNTPFHPSEYMECSYVLKGDTLYIEDFWPTYYYEYAPATLIRQQ